MMFIETLRHKPDIGDDFDQFKDYMKDKIPTSLSKEFMMEIAWQIYQLQVCVEGLIEDQDLEHSIYD